jgi:hypothetical protein
MAKCALINKPAIHSHWNSGSQRVHLDFNPRPKEGGAVSPGERTTAGLKAYTAMMGTCISCISCGECFSERIDQALLNAIGAGSIATESMPLAQAKEIFGNNLEVINPVE